MTTIDRDLIAMWRQIAIDAGDDPYANTLHPDEVIALLDALTRAEAQSETRRQQTKYWQERAEGFEARIQAVRGIAPTIPADDDDRAWRIMTDLEAGEMFAWEDVLDILNS